MVADCQGVGDQGGMTCEVGFGSRACLDKPVELRSPERTRGIEMRRREFIAGLAVRWPGRSPCGRHERGTRISLDASVRACTNMS
jgi:hypothetical protein